MKKFIVFFMCVALIVLLCSCNPTSMYASNDVGEYVEAKDGYLIQASAVDTTQCSTDIDKADFTIKCGRDMVDICYELEYWDDYFGACFTVEFRHYIVRIDNIVYGVKYVTMFADDVLYLTGYNICSNEDEWFLTEYGKIWTELNDYSSIENMPRILQYFFLTSPTEVNESGFMFNSLYSVTEENWQMSAGMVFQILQLCDNCIVEVKVSNIGNTFVSTTSMPNEVRDFTNMVGEAVSIEGPAYNK